ncbi:Os06g0563800 [Oryza sativa Japonica Group]|uniref:Uncharacterized protein n=4 Tax=Oryza TaxID=4527 RepID=A3BCT4_ORYSJ|nr:hypothetical protein OsI_23392 [Oryza sativa Indica Group]EAZ37373.1 hypothetical protein OsJ_21712 [Oryza sativa Japonica Group]BAD53760.1 hypothetical protein [Oryza sativa Japonica Group]BAS98265.1 Os06g0563800 [Oryza sativa Japonica Group]
MELGIDYKHGKGRRGDYHAARSSLGSQQLPPLLGVRWTTTGNEKEGPEKGTAIYRLVHAIAGCSFLHVAFRSEVPSKDKNSPTPSLLSLGLLAPLIPPAASSSLSQ